MNDIKSVAGASPGQALQKKDNPAELKKALTEFEALFINQMLKSMRDTVMKSGFLHGGSGEEIYNSLLDTELSRVMAHSGGIGLEKAFINQLTREFSSEALPRPYKAVSPEPTGADDVHDMERDDIKGKVKVEEKMAEPLKFPVHGRVSSNFGYRKDPFTGDVRFHHGLDIAAREGTPVYPAAAGRVIFSGEKGGYGNMVEIMHENGLVTRYGHNSRNLVREGDAVSVSEPIAFAGSTGRSTGAHLHFEVLRDGAPVDPNGLLAADPVLSGAGRVG